METSMLYKQLIVKHGKVTVAHIKLGKRVLI